MADLSQRHLDGYTGTIILLPELFYLECKEYQGFRAAQRLLHPRAVKEPTEGQRKLRRQRRSYRRIYYTLVVLIRFLRPESRITWSRSPRPWKALCQIYHWSYRGREGSEKEIRRRTDHHPTPWSPKMVRRSPCRTTTCILSNTYTVLVKAQVLKAQL